MASKPQLTCSPFPLGCGILNGQYCYTEDLLALERVSVTSQSSGTVLSADERVLTGFLPLPQWQPFLQAHPDQAFAEFVRRGITHGFRVGFDPINRLKSAPQNFHSVRDNPLTVHKYIADEVAQGRLVKRPGVDIRRNPIGIIPKPHQPGKFRLIVDLSAPRGFSVNDGISPSLCSLDYISVDQAARLIAKCGRGALMAKTDLQSAYRQVPVHPEDQHLLGLEWDGQIYCDRALPFGLRSAPKLFTAVADGLAWSLHCEGITNCVHYLDDFLFWGPAESDQCGLALEKATSLCDRLGLPVAAHKTVGPATVLTFLGIEVDSVSQELRLPEEKLSRLRALLSQWSTKRHASKHDLQVLLGHLSHAATVVRPGRVFLRQLIDTTKLPRLPSHKVRLNAGCRADISWWATFVQNWNGVALFPQLPTGPKLVSDASGSWGCGAYCPGEGTWFQLRWPPSWADINIAAKELLPIVAAAAIWGKAWNGTVIKVHSDNQAVVACLTSRSARDPLLAHLLRCLFFFEAHFRFEHRAQHIAGKLNTAADALSRDRLKEFFSIFPQANQQPSLLPGSLVELLLDSSLSWTSPHWKELFATTLSTGLPSEP